MNKEIEVVTKNKINTPESKFMDAMNDLLSAYESNLRSERIKAGIRRKKHLKEIKKDKTGLIF